MKFAVAVERFSGSINKLRNLTGTKIGLKNVRERLEKLYGEKGGFELRQDSEFVVAKIDISKAGTMV